MKNFVVDQPQILESFYHLTDLTKKNVKPGKQICRTCKKELEERRIWSSSSSKLKQNEIDIIERLNRSLTAIDLPPLKFQQTSMILEAKQNERQVKLKM